MFPRGNGDEIKSQTSEHESTSSSIFLFKYNLLYKFPFLKELKSPHLNSLWPQSLVTHPEYTPVLLSHLWNYTSAYHPQPQIPFAPPILMHGVLSGMTTSHLNNYISCRVCMRQPPAPSHNMEVEST